MRLTAVLGLTETEFSLVRFSGDAERAGAMYRNMEALQAVDIAETVYFVASRPAHVQISDITVLPTSQASVYHVHRSPC